MGLYKAAVVTNAGNSMVTQSIAEKKPITFTKAETSNYPYPPETDIQGMTELQGVVQSSIPSEAKVVSDMVLQVTARFGNENVDSQYLIETIGIYARLEGDNEKLFAVIQADTPDQMPAKSPVSPSAFIYNFMIAVNQADEITITVDPSGTATIQDIIDLKKNKSNIIVIPEDEDIPVEDREPKTWYLKVTDQQTAGGGDEIKVSPNMGLKILN